MMMMMMTLMMTIIIIIIIIIIVLCKMLPEHFSFPCMSHTINPLFAMAEASLNSNWKFVDPLLSAICKLYSQTKKKLWFIKLELVGVTRCVGLCLTRPSAGIRRYWSFLWQHFKPLETSKRHLMRLFFLRKNENDKTYCSCETDHS